MLTELIAAFKGLYEEWRLAINSHDKNNAKFLADRITEVNFACSELYETCEAFYEQNQSELDSGKLQILFNEYISLSLKLINPDLPDDMNDSEFIPESPLSVKAKLTGKPIDYYIKKAEEEQIKGIKNSTPAYDPMVA